MSPEKRAYFNAKNRCTLRNTPYWKNYGGRGIKFLFKSYKQFLREVGRKPSPRHELDRIENNGNYEPGNVQWATKAENNAHRRPISEAAKKIMSIAAKKRCTPEWRKAVSLRVKEQYEQGKLGQATWSEETKRETYKKIGLALRGRPGGRLGKKATPEQCERYRLAALKREAKKRVRLGQGKPRSKYNGGK